MYAGLLKDREGWESQVHIPGTNIWGRNSNKDYHQTYIRYTAVLE